jgi:hypothetical protein
MLAGRVLEGEDGRVCYFDTDGFFFDKQGIFHREPLAGLSGLWEEL